MSFDGSPREINEDEFLGDFFNVGIGGREGGVACGLLSHFTCEYLRSCTSRNSCRLVCVFFE